MRTARFPNFTGTTKAHAMPREHITIPHGPHKVELHESYGGSKRFGPCEVCGQSCEITYFADPLFAYFSETHGNSHTTLPGHVGHRQCVLSACQSDLDKA